MKHKKILVVLLVALFFAAAFSVSAAGRKINLKKAVITSIDGFTIIATKKNKTYTINAQRAVLRNAKGKRAAIDQFFVDDQIDVKGTRNDGIITAKTIKDRSLKPEDLTRRSVGAENMKDEAISSPNFIGNGVITEDKLQAGTITNASISNTASIDSSKLNLSNVSSLTANTANITTLTAGTANLTTLDLGTNTITDGNFTGNWNFNSGNLSGVGTISSGNITTSGTITANGTGNSYFAGNVGIGTTSPVAPLEINSASDSRALLIGGVLSITPNYIDGVRKKIYIGINTYQHPTGWSAIDPTVGSFVLQMEGNNPDTNSAFYLRYRNAGTPANTSPSPIVKFSHTGGLALGNAYYTKTPPDGGAIIYGNVGIGTTSPGAKLTVNGQVNLPKNSSQPYACDATRDGDIALTNKYTTCVCKNGTGWVLTADGTTACTWD